MVKNQGIAHLANKAGGFPACRNKQAHISVSRERFKLELKPCKKCSSILAKLEAREKGKETEHANNHQTTDRT